MYKDENIRVVIVEDDLYSRDLMTLLLTRDWRTQVAATASNQAELEDSLLTLPVAADILLIDVDHAAEPSWVDELLSLGRRLTPTTRILLIGTHPNESLVRRLVKLDIHGYLVKQEVLYSLAWAIALVMEGHWVITPGIQKVMLTQRISLPEKTMVLDGRHVLAEFTPRERQVALLAILYNLRHGDVADELLITERQVNKLVSNAYKKLELADILTNEVDVALLFQNQELIDRFRLAQRKGEKAPEKATLAFHLLTIPSIETF